uniref:Uncharacterized protein n=1 Tax=Strigamia maritima TaxID=126957 RepID=T1III2_STRMM
MDRFKNVWYLCIFLICNYSPITIGNDNNSTCLQSIYKLEALPGHGWDSLRNKEMGRVFQFTYHQCRKTEDGKYLIPDSTYVVAIKDSNLQTTSDLFEHFSDYSSVTSSSLKLMPALVSEDSVHKAATKPTIWKQKSSSQRQVDDNEIPRAEQHLHDPFITRFNN